jgi:hypothetical protein
MAADILAVGSDVLWLLGIAAYISYCLLLLADISDRFSQK